MRFRFLAAALAFAFLASALAAETPAAPAAQDPEPNTWAKAAESPTGRRDQPVFVYVPALKRFVMASGMQSNGGVPPRHYDTEEFDLAAGAWTNAYPPALAEGRPASGPVGQEYSKAREKMCWNGPELFYKDGEFLRPGCGGQWQTTKLNYEFCYASGDGKVYAYLYDKTLRYDPAARSWQDLGAKPRTSCRIWGAMCYDPVNKEILHAGGDGGTAAIATWAYSLEKNEWRTLEFGSDALKDLATQARALTWQAKALLGACCNRFAVSETPAEAKADLPALAAALCADAGKLAGAAKAAKLAEHEKHAGEIAVLRLASAAEAIKAAGANLAGTLTPEHLAAVRAVRVQCEQVEDALCAEPPGRARSQAAYDPVHKKIVLFGGDGLDRTLSDTWVYDCAARTWEQRFPEKCPAPRAGHIFAWLPKASKFVLAGGYSRVPLAHELWTYDVAADAWKLLKHVPVKTYQEGRERYTDSPGCPNVSSRGNLAGAANEDDVLVCPVSKGGGLVTWRCTVDASKADEAGTAEHGAASGSYTFSRIDPANWEKAAKPDAAQGKKFLDELPANRWTSVPFPMYAPGATNRWGTTAYDTDRHQLLFYGGGHSTSQEDDVAHFSVLGGFWTLGYHPDHPIEIIYASVPTPLSFRDRPHVPMHAYKTYDYDPTAGRMLYLEHVYNPAVREWERKTTKGLQHAGILNTFFAPTPKGMVSYSAKGLFRYDAKTETWAKLPWDGPAFGGLWCDGHALCYDSKRDCLWLANDKVIFRYDLAAGKAENANIAKPKALGQFFFWREVVYLPDADLLLAMNLFAGPGGKPCNVAWDPNDGTFYFAELPFFEKEKEAGFKGNPFSWSDALRYDPALKLCVLNNSSARKVWLLKFDRQSAKLTAMPKD